MAFFDKLGETLSSKGRDVAKKAKELAEISSLNGQINTKEEMMRRTYEEIGKAYYEANKDDDSNLYAKQCKQITALYREIGELRHQIQVIKGIEVCPSCGTEIPSGAGFCPGCGVSTASMKAKEQSDSEPDSNKDTTTGTSYIQITPVVTPAEAEETVLNNPVSEEEFVEEPVLNNPVSEEESVEKVVSNNSDSEEQALVDNDPEKTEE